MNAVLLPLLSLFPVAADDDFREFKGHEGPTRVVRFTPDGTKLVSCSGWPEGDKTLRIWDVKTGKTIHTLTGHTDNIDGMCLSDDGKTILSGSSDGTARLWDVATGKELKRFEGHKKSGVPAVALAAGGKLAASGSGNGKMIVWKTDTLEEVFSVDAHTNHVRCLLFTSDGKSLISGSWDGTVKVWDVEKKAEKRTLTMPGKGVKVDNFALMPDGKELVVAGGRFSRWNLETGDEVKRYPGGALSVAISKDGKRMMTGRYQGEMILRDTDTGQEKAKFVAHEGTVYWVEFAPDGKTVASAGGGARDGDKYNKGTDFAVRIWTLDD